MTESIQRQLLALLCIINLTISLVLANLYHVNGLYKTFHQDVRLESRVRRQVINESQIGNLHGRPGEGYYLQVEIGTPPQKLNVIIDTGSSNFAVACEPNKDITSYFNRKQSSSYEESGRAVNVPYTQGSWDGVLGRDVVIIPSLSNSTVLANIACITSANSFFINTSDWQGILGLGYADIARPDSSVEPLFDSLVNSKQSDNVFSVQLCGLGYISPNPESVVGGSVIFGGISPNLYTGALYPTPINKAWYYEVIILDVEVAGKTLDMDCKEYNFGKTIVDTGTTNLRLPNRVFSQLIKQMSQEVKSAGGLDKLASGFWTGEQVMCVKKGQVPYHKFPTISITLPANITVAFKLIVAPQHYLRHVGEENDDSPENDCYKIGISPLEEGSVLGAIVMEGFYVVFDRANNQVLFANTTCGTVDNNAVRSRVDGYIKYTGDYKDCAYKKVDPHSSTVTVVGYVLAGICGICLLPLIVLLVQWQCCKCRCNKMKRSNSDFNDLMEDTS